MANKIKYGLEQVYYAVATIAANGSATYATPVALPGAVNLSLEAQGDQNVFYADNIAYYVSQANNGYQGDLELALIPDAFRTDILGEHLSTTGKVLVEEAETTPVHFALLFQFNGDANGTRYCMYNCIASRPGATSTTKAEAIEPQTETVQITATSVYNASLDKDVVRGRTCDTTTTTVYDDWYQAVWQATD